MMSVNDCCTRILRNQEIVIADHHHGDSKSSRHTDAFAVGVWSGLTENISEPRNCNPLQLFISKTMDISELLSSILILSLSLKDKIILPFRILRLLAQCRVSSDSVKPFSELLVYNVYFHL